MEDAEDDFEVRTRLAAELAEAQGFVHTARALRGLLAPAAPAPLVVRAPHPRARPAAAASRRGGRTPPDIRPATAPGPSPRRIPKGWVEEAGIAAAALRIRKAIRAAWPRMGRPLASGR